MIELKNFISKLLHHQINKIYKKGLNYLFSVIICLLVIHFTVQYLNSGIWNYLLSLFDYNTRNFYVISTISFSLLCALFYSIFYYAIQYIPSFQKYKIINNLEDYPWVKDQKKIWSYITKKNILLMILNIGIISPLLIIYQSSFTKVRINDKVPNLLQILPQLYFIMLTQSFAFYIMHALSHKYFYRFHKVHHQYKMVQPITVYHFHPIDYILGIIVPLSIGPKILSNSLHLFTALLWIWFRTGQGFDKHCNYQIPWIPFGLIPFSTSSQYHLYHHTYNIGTYGSMIANDSEYHYHNKVK